MTVRDQNTKSYRIHQHAYGILASKWRGVGRCITHMAIDSSLKPGVRIGVSNMHAHSKVIVDLIEGDNYLAVVAEIHYNAVRGSSALTAYKPMYRLGFLEQRKGLYLKCVKLLPSPYQA
jgi:hypothetical protein